VAQLSAVTEQPSELADLQRRITARLQEKGPANIKTLASELNAPQPEVWLALQKLRESGSRLVESRPDGTWDLVGVYRKRE
jgi:Mn-dependent DtxR family transcriptional regulator